MYSRTGMSPAGPGMVESSAMGEDSGSNWVSISRWLRTCAIGSSELSSSPPNWSTGRLSIRALASARYPSISSFHNFIDLSWLFRPVPFGQDGTTLAFLWAMIPFSI